jgi:pyruvate dehydrogenase E1 component alpha subunit
MPEKTIESFKVKFLQVLDQDGNADKDLMPALGPEDIKKIYGHMVLSRSFDERALALQREGRLGTYASIRGQEAAQVASAYAFDSRDWVFPSFRESGMHIARGYPIDMLYQFWAGDERGLRSPAELNIFPVCISVSTHIPHAVGVAIAAKYRGDKIATIVYFGDGATSKGDFHEGFNIAGVARAPVVFICQNNQWAISVPRFRQTASATLAQKAFSYGFEGIQVDGNDAFAVYKATNDALLKARRGDGPTFIECFTYRLLDHTTADNASRYRPAEEVREWEKRDPILRLRLYLEKENLAGGDYFEAVQKEAKERIDEAVKKAEETAPPDPLDIFRFTYHEITTRQKKEMKALGLEAPEYARG